MNDSTEAQILRCRLCNKPFDQQASLKRHGYYCRSRTAGHISRLRSCVSCVKAKTRCDGVQPSCSRCSSKGLGCRFPATKLRAKEPPELGRLALAKQQTEAATNTASSLQQQALIVTDDGARPSINDTILTDLDWTRLDAGIFDFLSSTTTLPSPAPPLLPRSLARRPEQDMGAQRVARLILHTLKSYLVGMLRHDTLPPFVHPSLQSQAIALESMEPLANCISLVHMIDSPKGSRKLFWKNVRLECDRMRADRHGFDAMQVLTAMQALSIYILIRLDEGETENNNLDSQMIDTVTVLAGRIGHLDTTRKMALARDPGAKPTWHDWLLEESRRRLSIVFRIINMLVYFEPAGLCTLPNDLMLAPLPARKLLWEATEEQFESHMQSEDVVHAYAMARTGDLVRLTSRLSSPQLDHTDLTYEHEMLSPVTIRGVASWEEWLADMDGFGGLVMLAASMVQ